MESKREISFYSREPWCFPSNLTVHSTLDGILKKDESETANRAAASNMIRNVSPDITIYTDGSASAGTTNGGAGIVIAGSDPFELDVRSTLMVKGAALTCSYEEENQAMLSACQWIRDNCTPQQKILTMTDSKSLCDALLAQNAGTDEILKTIQESDADIVVQWVPAHCGIPGNEEADKAAKNATKLEGPHRPVSFSSACSAIRRCVRDKPLKLSEHQTIYASMNRQKELEVESRKDQVDLARLRSGYHPALMTYQHILNEEVSPMCPRCGEAEDTTRHWLTECPATAEAKMRLFGTVELGLDTLTKEPKKSIALARRTILCGASTQ
jgi:ribonuclease HI